MLGAGEFGVEGAGEFVVDVGPVPVELCGEAGVVPVSLGGTPMGWSTISCANRARSHCPPWDAQDCNADRRTCQGVDPRQPPQEQASMARDNRGAALAY